MLKEDGVQESISHCVLMNAAHGRQEASVTRIGNGFSSGLKTRMPSTPTAFVGAVASQKLPEEGCHSAEFDATIHVGHHLLLS